MSEGLGEAREEEVTRRTIRRVDLSLSTPFGRPQSESELALAAIWRDVLCVDEIGTADDFFELGGDSFAATSLAAEIEATFNVCFAPSDIINFSTIAEQAHSLVSAPSKLPPSIFLGRAGGSKPPLFLVHGGTGFSFFHPAFFEEVGQDRPIYLFQAPGFDGRTKPLNSVEAIAALYITSMREIQSSGPFYIAGMCVGAFIALEICNQLTKAGQTIARLILLDPKSKPRALLGRYPKSRGLKAPMMRFVTWLKEALKHEDFEEQLEHRARLLRQHETRRDRRSPAYSADLMLEASLQLNHALKIYVPRPFNGKAFLLVSSQRAQSVISEGSFWRHHLAELEHRICDGHHRDIFGCNIMQTAHLVKSVLDDSVFPATVSR
jgi:thioesterase domain-containing protein/acyl carrier protein